MRWDMMRRKHGAQLMPSPELFSEMGCTLEESRLVQNLDYKSQKVPQFQPLFPLQCLMECFGPQIFILKMDKLRIDKTHIME